MKLFLIVILAATVIGGFAGAEVLDTSFSVIGAVIGGVGTAAALLGLGAYFDAQARKSPELPPEIRGVFDRMITGKKTQRHMRLRRRSKALPKLLNLANPVIRTQIQGAKVLALRMPCKT